MEMITRDEVLSQAVNQCIKELYSLVQPHVEWDEFVIQNKLYSNQYKIWEESRDTDPNYIGKSIVECIGPRPYEFYYLPKEVMKRVCDSYVYAYRIDTRQEFLDSIEVLKNYCKEPIVDKWIEGEDENDPGHRGYEHPDSLHKELATILKIYCDDSEADFGYVAQEIQNKFFEFLDMAGNFYNWNRDLNTFSVSVYLGPSPNSNKEAVIENWKKYRDKDIKIDEKQYEDEDIDDEQIEEEFYGEELD